MAKKQVKAKAQYCYRDCKNSYDWHEKNVDGEFFMCRCKLSQWSKLLSSPQCKDFELKTK